MSYVIKFLFLIVFLTGSVSCGIKGAPVPPQQPFFISDGDKSLKSAEEAAKEKKIRDAKSLENKKSRGSN